MCKRGEKIRVVGVSRGNEYSPNHVDNDAAILRLAAEALERMGCEVTIYPEKEFVAQNIEGEFIFDMARDRATIERLKELEDGGALVVNSAYAGVTSRRVTVSKPPFTRGSFISPIIAISSRFISWAIRP